MLATALAVLAAGCAGQQPAQRLQDEAARFVYVAPPEKILAQARALLEARGYTVHRAPNGGLALSTPWKPLVAGQGMGNQARRYLVAVRELGQGRSVVRIHSLTYTAVPTGNTNPAIGGHAYASGTTEGGDMRFVTGGEGTQETKTSSVRDLVMEWQLFQRLEPELAEELERNPQAGSAAAPGR